MPPRSYTFRPPTNPLLLAVWFVVAGVVLLSALVMSAIVLAVALGLAVVGGVVVLIRVWWLKRRLARSGGAASRQPELLEVEYEVVAERSEPGRRNR